MALISEDGVISDRLPLTYYSGSNKYEFIRQDTNLVVNFYDSSGLLNSFKCIQHDNQLGLVNSDAIFAISGDGKLYIEFTDTHVMQQLSLSRLK